MLAPSDLVLPTASRERRQIQLQQFCRELFVTDMQHELYEIGHYVVRVRISLRDHALARVVPQQVEGSERREADGLHLLETHRGRE